MASAELLTAVRDARRAAFAADRAGQPEAAATIRARAAELTSQMNAAVALESAPRRLAQAQRQAELDEAMLRALANLNAALLMGR